MTVASPLSPNIDTAQSSVAPDASRIEQAKIVAQKLEASFLSELLESAGFGEQVSTFAGGTGEDQFASFHRDAIAERMARAGGIGLAEHFFKAMMEQAND